MQLKWGQLKYCKFDPDVRFQNNKITDYSIVMLQKAGMTTQAQAQKTGNDN